MVKMSVAVAALLGVVSTLGHPAQTPTFREQFVEPVLKMASDIEQLEPKILEQLSSSVDGGYKFGLQMFDVSNEVQELLRHVAPSYIEMYNLTSAPEPDEQLTKDYGDLPETAQQELLDMLKWSMKIAPEVIAMSGKAGVKEMASFGKDVLAQLPEAEKHVKQAMMNAWTDAKLQLPRMESLTLNVTENPVQGEMVHKVACAADYATSLGKLTQLYSSFVTITSDCENGEDYQVEDCASSALDLVARQSAFIADSSKMMWSCFDSHWGCTHALMVATTEMSKAMAEGDAMKAMCKSTESGAKTICEMSAFNVLGHLGYAVGAMHLSTTSCAQATTQ